MAMAKKLLMTVSALIGAVAVAGQAPAADVGGTASRQWGGFWLGFGAGYAGSSSSSESKSSEVCLTSARGAITSASCGAAEGGGLGLETGVFVIPGNGNDAEARNQGIADLTQIGTGNESLAVVADSNSVTELAEGEAIAVAEPPGSAETTTSAEVGGGFQGSQAIAIANGNNPSIDTKTPKSSTGTVDALASASGFTVANSASGLYGGASYSSASSGNISSEALAIAIGGLSPADLSDNEGGLSPNIHVYFDHQTESNWVIGAGVDLNFTGASGASTSSLTTLATSFGAGADQHVGVERGYALDTNLIASARLRLGYAMGNVMLYGTGGVAYADFDATVTTAGSYMGKSASVSDTVSGNAFGAVIGGGVSTFVAENAVVSLEGLYYKFDGDVDFNDVHEDATVTLEDAFSVMMKFSIRTN